MGVTIKERERIEEILAEACRRRDLLILATPYLRFESHFVAVQDGELHVAATMSREDARYSLRTPELKLRFPNGLGFFETPAQVTGLGMVEGRHTVRLALPKRLSENDQRSAYRVERVGKVEVTFSSPRLNLYSAALVDISTSGARLHVGQDLPPSDFQPDVRLLVTIPLVPDIRIEGPALIRHLRGRNMGIEFVPPLPMPLVDHLSRWVFLRREEERERLAQRLESSRSLPQPGGTAPEAGLLLLSAESELESQLKSALKELPPLRRIAPAAQELKEALAGQPLLVIFHLQALGLDERRRMKALVEMAQKRAPTLLLGTELDGSALFELSSEWRASSALVWSPGRALFLARLVQGMIRRHRDNAEGPLAPAEGQEARP